MSTADLLCLFHYTILCCKPALYFAGLLTEKVQFLNRLEISGTSNVLHKCIPHTHYILLKKCFLITYNVCVYGIHLWSSSEVPGIPNLSKTLIIIIQPNSRTVKKSPALGPFHTCTDEKGKYIGPDEIAGVSRVATSSL